jgi:hypothetical protein
MSADNENGDEVAADTGKLALKRWARYNQFCLSLRKSAKQTLMCFEDFLAIVEESTEYGMPGQSSDSFGSIRF